MGSITGGEEPAKPKPAGKDEVLGVGNESLADSWAHGMEMEQAFRSFEGPGQALGSVHAVDAEQRRAARAAAAEAAMRRAGQAGMEGQKSRQRNEQIDQLGQGSAGYAPTADTGAAAARTQVQCLEDVEFLGFVLSISSFPAQVDDDEALARRLQEQLPNCD